MVNFKILSQIRHYLYLEVKKTRLEGSGEKEDLAEFLDNLPIRSIYEDVFKLFRIHCNLDPMLVKEKMKYKLRHLDKTFDSQLDKYINNLEITHYNMI